MPRGVAVDPADPEVRAQVLEALRSMAGDKAPSRNDWLHSRPDGLPGGAWIQRNWGWAATVRAAGLDVQQPKDERDAAAADLDAPLDEDEAHAWLQGFWESLPGGLPVCDNPRDLGGGRWAWRVR